MDMGQKDLPDPLPPHSLTLLQNPVNILGGGKRDINDGNLLPAQEILVGSLERHVSRIGRGEVTDEFQTLHIDRY